LRLILASYSTAIDLNVSIPFNSSNPENACFSAPRVKASRSIERGAAVFQQGDEKNTQESDKHNHH